MAKFELPKLPYDYNALEPYIDEETMKLHHTKHHQAYTDKFNKAYEDTNIQTENIFEIFEKVSEYPAAIRNQGGGYWNHIFFWESMSPDGGEPDKELMDAIVNSFGSFDEFKNKFSNSATTLFGSGWTWLGVRENGELVIFNTQNQDNPYMDCVDENATPILALDVWEHAYYLKYQNKRPEYIENFYNVINWTKVSQRYLETRN